MSRFLILFFLVFGALSVSGQSGGFSKSYGGSGSEWFYDMAMTADSNYILVGDHDSSGAGGKDVLVIKINRFGDTLWTRIIGTSADDIGTCVKETADSGCIVAGYTAGYGTGDYDIFVTKLGASGVSEWMIKVGDTVSSEYAFCVNIDPMGNIYIGGQIIPNQNWYDALLVKLTATGTYLWSKTYGGPFGDTFTQIHFSDSNSMYVLGTVSSPNQQSRPSIYKLNTFGDTIWIRYFYHDNINDAAINFLRLTDGGFYLLCTTQSQGNPAFLLIRTDSIGNPLWGKIYKSWFTTRAHDICALSSNSFLVTGWNTYSLGNHAWSLKIDLNGDTLRTSNYGPTGGEYLYRIKPHLLGALAAGWHWVGTGNRDFLISTIDTTGVPPCNSVYSLMTILPASVSLTSFPISIDSLVPSTTVTMTENYSIPMYSHCPNVGINVLQKPGDCDLKVLQSPNEIILEFSKNIPNSKMSLSVYNSLGALMNCNYSCIEKGIRIETSTLSSGMYYFRYTSEDCYSGKGVFIW